MGRKKKISFKLNPEWMLKEPVDFEFNKYTLLNYLQKCEERFDKLEIYPDFVEISLHLANLQSLAKEKTLLLTNKKFESCDDEILLKELFPKKSRQLTENEEYELDKTIKFSGNKLFDAFNTAKSIWNLAYDGLEVNLKKGKKNLLVGEGYVYLFSKHENKVSVWEYQIKKPKKGDINSKAYLNLIYEGEPGELTLSSIIETFSTNNKNKELPIFEAKCSQSFPMEQTLIPILKRKIMAYIFQTVNYEKINNFDSKI
jgi:hypothetical protein